MENGLMEWLLSLKYGSPEERELRRQQEEQQKIAMIQQAQGQVQPPGYANRSTVDQIRQRRQAEENALRW